MSRLEPIGEDVRRELGRFPAGAEMAAVVAAWPGVVGVAIAGNAWPVRLARDGTLHVATSSAAWSFELTQLRGEILPRLQSAVEKDASIAALRFVPGLLPATDADASAEPRPTAPQVTPETAAEAKRLAAEIGDETLRNLVARAAAASLERARTDRSV